MIDDHSPLRFLDFDVSRKIYETYFPSPLIKEQFNQVIDQLKYHIKNYNAIGRQVSHISKSWDIHDFVINYKSHCIHKGYGKHGFLQYVTQQLKNTY